MPGLAEPAIGAAGAGKMAMRPPLLLHAETNPVPAPCVDDRQIQANPNSRSSSPLRLLALPTATSVIPEGIARGGTIRSSRPRHSCASSTIASPDRVEPLVQEEFPKRLAGFVQQASGAALARCLRSSGRLRP
jgi:hypothetical protein